MASEPTPSTERLARTARPLRSRSDGPRLGTAARAAVQLRAGIGAGLTRRIDDEDAVGDVPWGLWRRAGSGEPAPAPHGNAALARYAAALRRRRGADTAAPARGLPLTVRRTGATAAGPHTGPGGLTRSLAPTDRPERADIAAILRDGRPPSNPMPTPLATASALSRPRPDRVRR